MPDEFRERRAAYVELIINEQAAARSLKKILPPSVMCFAKKAFSASKRHGELCQAAKSHGFGLRLHADQLSPGRRRKTRAAELAASTADHLEHTDAVRHRRTSREACAARFVAKVKVYALGLATLTRRARADD